MIYLDHAATTAPSQTAIRACVEAMERTPGNPSSVHGAGMAAMDTVRRGRARVAAALGARADEILFTAGGTEADNLAIRGAVSALRRRGDHVVTTNVEHPAVENTLADLERQGLSVTRVPVGPDGCVSAEDVLAAVTDRTVLVTVMAVCSETGARMPIEEIAARLKREHPDVLFHSDMVQSFCRERIPLAGVDMASVSAHKICAPKGCGALYLRKGVRILPVITGGGQEGGLRSGTEAVPLIAAFGAAAEENMREFAARRQKIAALRKAAEEQLSAVPGLEFLQVRGVPDVFTVFLPGYKSEVLLRFLSEKGICVSAGSACAKGKKSPVLTAMGLPPEKIDGALRVSMGHENTPEELSALAEALREATRKLASVR